MAENYKPKKIGALYDMAKGEMKCPNCHEDMGRNINEAIFFCFNEKCRLFDVKYRAVKTLVTLEKM